MRVPEVSQMVNHEKSLTALQVRPHENDPALYVHTATLLSRASLFPPPPQKKKNPLSILNTHTYHPIIWRKDSLTLQASDAAIPRSLSPRPLSPTADHLRVLHHIDITSNDIPTVTASKHPTLQPTISPAFPCPSPAVTPLTAGFRILSVREVSLSIYTAWWHSLGIYANISPPITVYIERKANE